jgi:hypothetical protein
MKYIITESQYIKLKEDIFNSDDENNIIGNSSELTLMLADFLLRQDLVDIRRMLISDDEIEIFGFGEPILEYFMDNSISFQVIGAERDVHVNVVANDDIEGEYPEREEAFNFIRNLAEDFSFVNWYIEGDRI